MSDLISRRDAIDAIQNQAIHTPEALNDIGIAYYEGLHFAFQLISMLPSAEPERKTGKWVKTGQSFVYPDKFRNYMCSECGCDIEKTKYYYCPWCGAKMERE